MITKRLPILIAALLLLGACAVGNQYDYTSVTTDVPATGATGIAVAVAEQRPYVLSGDKGADFIGLQRGGFGNPFDVTTSTGQPLAHDFATLLARNFDSAGGSAEVVALAPGQGAEQALDAFRRTGAERLLLIEMREWKTDVYAQVTVHWDLTAKVYDSSGRLLGQDRIQGKDGTGTSGVFESEKSRIAAAAAARRLGELLAKPDVAAALG